ncbi:hypothetical protein DDZ13_06460 [Coraliomargarita sinensis]|uniref:Uncharacterized protein n=1 Tax=Coraliomargarita sinensis TaxID=2174842 RepID=A0A317ZGM8_9BACT|nr:hypothetical protein [Coraliomargarita sinensis]PXA04804.1 hypothetical protein DDZ13_06460 [Coraliomargarita sinensis]
MDPLDRKIDDLLASRPAKAPDDFADRTLAKLDARAELKKSGGLASLIRFALPMAAAVALAFILYKQFTPDGTEAPAQVADSPISSDEDLNSYEIQEILLLQEGLAGFARIEAEELSRGDDLLITLETLYSI